jgi:hypothetical protein
MRTRNVIAKLFETRESASLRRFLLASVQLSFRARETALPIPDSTIELFQLIDLIPNTGRVLIASHPPPLKGTRESSYARKNASSRMPLIQFFFFSPFSPVCPFSLSFSFWLSFPLLPPFAPLYPRRLNDRLNIYKADIV